MQSDNSHGTVIVAEEQTTGKGRLGRTWHSPIGKNLYCSIVLTQTPPLFKISWIPILTGVALSESLEACSDLTISLKWPNDILIGNRKLAGVLCEARQQCDGHMALVVGVGVNINCEKEDFPLDLQDTATSLKLEGHRPFDRERCLAEFLSSFETHYLQLLTSDTANLRARYISKCTTLGQTVRVQLVTQKSLAGLAVDIGQEGELQIILKKDRQLEKDRELEQDPCLDKDQQLDQDRRGQQTLSIRSGDVFHVR